MHHVGSKPDRRHNRRQCRSRLRRECTYSLECNGQRHYRQDGATQLDYPKVPRRLQGLEQMQEMQMQEMQMQMQEMQMQEMQMQELRMQELRMQELRMQELRMQELRMQELRMQELQ